MSVNFGLITMFSYCIYLLSFFLDVVISLYRRGTVSENNAILSRINKKYGLLSGITIRFVIVMVIFSFFSEPTSGYIAIPLGAILYLVFVFEMLAKGGIKSNSD